MRRWQPFAILAFAAAGVLVVLQAMTQGAPTPRAIPGVPPGPAAPARPTPVAPPRAGPPESSGNEPWAAAEEQLLSERTFSHPVSAPAPTPRAEMPDGRWTKVAPTRGQVMLVSFWATWCPPCVAEMPSLLALGRALREAHPGRFRLVAVSGDESWDEVKAFFARAPGGAPGFLEQVRDPDGSAARAYYCAARGYCPNIMYPETYLIDREGRIVAMMVGPRDWSLPEARQLVESVMGKG